MNEKPDSTLLAFSFCCDHNKSHVGRLDAADHYRMLRVAMRCADPSGAYRKLVSAVGAFGGATEGDEAAAIAADIVREASVVAIPANPGHHHGSSAAIRNAVEYAVANGFTFMVYLAEDIACLEMDMPGRLVGRLVREGLDYIAQPWGSHDEISTQVFACRVDRMLGQDGRCFVRWRGGLSEAEVLSDLRRRDLRVAFDRQHFYSTHHPRQFWPVAERIASGGGPLRPGDQSVRALCGTRWTYRRVGFDQRPMMFEADGMIGEGWGGCEVAWRLHRPDAGLAMDVFGMGGLLVDSAQPTPDGRWLGRWLYGERMAIEWVPEGHPALEPDGPESELARRYRSACEVGSDINEHVPLLWLLARQCDHVTEMGTRWAVSTTAFLFARPRRLVCYDIDRHPQVGELAAMAGPVEFSFHEADVRQVEIEPTDLLFIDTYHTGSQLRAELAAHADRARRWIVLHDTTTFGQRGEDGIDGNGLWPAVEEFLAAQPQWRLGQRHENNNGLTVLERMPTQ